VQVAQAAQVAVSARAKLAAPDLGSRSSSQSSVSNPKDHRKISAISVISGKKFWVGWIWLIAKYSKPVVRL